MTVHAATLSRSDIEVLGRYNAEVARGLLHTPEWKMKMAELQARFDGTPR